MRYLFVAILLVAAGRYGYCQGPGLLLDDYVHPYLVDTSEEKDEEVNKEAASVKEKPSRDSQSVVEEKRVTAPVQRKKIKPAKEMAVSDKTNVKSVPEKPSCGRGGVKKTTELPASAKKETERPPDGNVQTVMDIQRAIALQTARNQLAELKQANLRIQLEIEKMNKEIAEIIEPAEKAQATEKPVYVQSSGRISGDMGLISEFNVLMVSSAEGMRAYVLDGGNAYYVRKGEQVSIGRIKNITAQGVMIEKKDRDVFYPVIQ